MYILRSNKTGKIMRMKNGEHFVYSDMRMAQMGKKYLEERFKAKLKIESA